MEHRNLCKMIDSYVSLHDQRADILMEVSSSPCVKWISPNTSFNSFGKAVVYTTRCCVCSEPEKRCRSTRSGVTSSRSSTGCTSCTIPRRATIQTCRELWFTAISSPTIVSDPCFDAMWIADPRSLVFFKDIKKRHVKIGDFGLVRHLEGTTWDEYTGVSSLHFHALFHSD
jgi:hypothetical protein